ncbi:MAG: 6-phosphofructokinase [Proteobacteria bacterium]|jgi:6-phosphofructokinase 1|nr:6-phosphofructokinase [Pseudomonadota bacterium]
MKKIGLLTGGGDCPGLNAVIRAVVKRSIGTHGLEVLGIREGWKGLISGTVEPLTNYAVTGILHRGGTILGTSRTNPYKSNEDLQRTLTNIKRFGIDAIIAVGGEDTLGVSCRLYRDYRLNIVGVPKTIDNDLVGTDYTFGFDTAVHIATEAIDRLHTTAESHHRIMVVEVMGRHTGWIATVAGMAGGADCILIPERPLSMEGIAEIIKKRHASGKTFSIVVVAEGFIPQGLDVKYEKEKTDDFDHIRLGGIGNLIGHKLEELTNIDTRVTILGHVQRGGTPTAYDRVLATRLGVKAVDMVVAGESGNMAALKGSDIVPVSLEEVIKGRKSVNMELYDIAQVFFG